jgi:putative FmdB family regulatory protein
MPVYVYAALKESANEVRDCEHCSSSFEVVQRMADEALAKCPVCGLPVVRMITAPNLNNAGKITKPSDRQLEQTGFTQYKRKGKGYYEKSFGSGPSTLQP